jgi:arginyl-tRNA synthetase
VIQEKLTQLIKEALSSLGIEGKNFVVEHPQRLAFGDYSTNAGIVSGKAKEIADYIEAHKPEEIEKVEIKAGFINFYLSKEFLAQSLQEIIEKGEDFGKNSRLKGHKVMVEYTDPNPFKEFHIGHLMSNAIGEAVSRTIEWSGAEVKRACYQGDVGMHVAKAVYGMIQNSDVPYAFGSKAFEDDENAKKQIQEINKKIYDRSDEEINKLYDAGKKASLEYFAEIYKRLGTKFDFNFFESEVWQTGKKIVEENTGKVFEKSDGAIVFKAEKYNEHLHTRVFINSEGLPTYEAKELGLAKIKDEKYSADKSIVITANEVNDYFKVLLCAMQQIFPQLAKKTKHLSHGILRLTTGKMSSRTGDVITAEALIDEVKKKLAPASQGGVGDEAVAVGAIKYMILRASIGGDIVFDLEKSVSTEGDSGVYLQYAHARASSLLEKSTIEADTEEKRGETHEIEKLLYRFPEVVERAMHEFAPHFVTTYLTELAGSFNNFYAHEKVLDDSPESAYRLAIVSAFKTVMKNGLTILGIPAPERM